MSIDISWSLIDDALTNRLISLLNAQLTSLPPFLKSCQITSLALGHIPPSLKIINITNPDAQFYDPPECEASPPPPYSKPPWESSHVPYFHSAFAHQSGILSASGLSTPRHVRSKEGDVQVEFEITWTGELEVKGSVEVSVNYPSSQFLSLPIRVELSDLEVSGICLVAVIGQEVHVSLRDTGSNPITGFKVRSEIGAETELVDMEKVERFMVSEVRNLVERELVYPSYYTFVL